MLTSKQRAKLRGFANKLQPVTQVGKLGVSQELCRAIELELETKELIKISVLETAGVSAREAADAIEEMTGADVVSVVGRKIVLFRVSSREECRKISAEI